jgi:hypothetical protein
MATVLGNERHENEIAELIGPTLEPDSRFERSHHNLLTCGAAMRFVIVLATALLVGCAVEPDPRTVPERNAAAEADVNRGIVCRNETPEGSEFSRPVCTTPAQREAQRESGQRQPDSAADLETKPRL